MTSPAFQRAASETEPPSLGMVLLLAILVRRPASHRMRQQQTRHREYRIFKG